MSADIIILDDALIQRRRQLAALQLNMVSTNLLIDAMKHCKLDIEASIKDIELALSVLRKI